MAIGCVDVSAIDKLREALSQLYSGAFPGVAYVECLGALDEIVKELAAVQAQNAELRRKLDSFVPLLVRSDCA